MKKEKKFWALTLIAFWYLSPGLINAQEQDSVRILREVTISGTRNEQPVIDVPRSVTVISSSTIQRSVYNSVADLLSAESGIYIIGATQTPGTNQGIFLRGANSNQVVVLIDGMKISDPSTPNGAIDLSEISLTNVERVEVIRGSHSTLYGGSAIGGVINIITKKGGQLGFHGTANVQAGTFGDGSLSTTASANVTHKFNSGIYVSGSVFHQEVKGLNATEDTIKSASALIPDKDDFRKTDIHLKAGYASDRWDVSISGKHSDQHADIDDRAYDDDDNAYLDFTRDLLDYSASLKVNPRVRMSLGGSFSRLTRYQQNDSSLLDLSGEYDRTYHDGKYNGTLATNELIATYSFKKGNAILGLGDFRETMNFSTTFFSNAFGFPYESNVNYDSIDISAATSYAFTQLSWDVGNLNLKGGARFNHHSLAGNFFTFEFSPSYHLRNALLYGSLSSGYNAPSLYQLYDPTTNADPSISRGNKKLKAEKSLSAEVGLKKEFNNGSYFTIAVFTSSIRNDIEYIYLWNKTVPIDEITSADYVGDLYVNISRQTNHGVELSGRLNAGKFYLQGNISATDGEVTVSPSDIPNDETGGHHVQLYNYGPFVTEKVTISQLARRPRFTGYAEAGIKVTPRFTFYSSLRHTGSRNDVEFNSFLGPFGALDKRKVDHYNLWDAGVQYNLTKYLAVHLKIENITNETYREIYGFHTRGRSGYARLSFTW